MSHFSFAFLNVIWKIKSTQITSDVTAFFQASNLPTVTLKFVGAYKSFLLVFHISNRILWNLTYLIDRSILWYCFTPDYIQSTHIVLKINVDKLKSTNEPDEASPFIELSKDGNESNVGKTNLKFSYHSGHS